MTALESDELLQFKLKTLIIFEYGQDKQNLTLDEFDVMTTHFIQELESKNVTIFSRSFGHKGNTVELGVIARDKTITSELISKQDTDLEPFKIQYEYFNLILFDVLKSTNA